MNVDALYVSEAVVDDGPRMKRLWARGRGRADILLKRFCHIKIAVRDREREETENSPQEKEERGE
jgi:large subunit ribosomal protein L22